MFNFKGKWKMSYEVLFHYIINSRFWGKRTGGKGTRITYRCPDGLDALLEKALEDYNKTFVCEHKDKIITKNDFITYGVMYLLCVDQNEEGEFVQHGDLEKYLKGNLKKTKQALEPVMNNRKKYK